MQESGRAACGASCKDPFAPTRRTSSAADGMGMAAAGDASTPLTAQGMSMDMFNASGKAMQV